jgi:hypothetical protein
MVFLVVGAVDLTLADDCRAGLTGLAVFRSVFFAEGADFTEGTELTEGAELTDGAADELGLAVDILMTMVVFGFPHHDSIF